MKYLSWIFGFISVISIVLVVCFFNKIRLVAAILETASEFVTSITRAVFVPPLMFILQLIFFAFWIYVALCIISSGTQVFS